MIFHFLKFGMSMERLIYLIQGIHGEQARFQMKVN